MKYTRIAETIRRLTGVVIDDDKTYLLENRLQQIMRDHACAGFDELSEMLESGQNPEIIRKVTDRITTHETKFFRDESIFDALIKQIIPEWMEKNEITPARLGTRRLDIWSAACSTGQEVYSILMLLHEFAPYLLPHLNITASDISLDSIDRAREAVYTEFEVSRGVPEHFLAKYFEAPHQNRSGLRIRADLRAVPKFVQHNLVSDAAPGLFDVILCRNVLIYFSEEHKLAILRRLSSALKADGVLILGSAESPYELMDDGHVIIRQFGLARYYELNTSRVVLF